MCRQPRKERSRPLAPKLSRGQRPGGLNSHTRELRHQERTAGDARNRAQRIGRKIRPVRGGWLKEFSPCRPIYPELRFHVLQAVFQCNGRAVAQRMRQRRESVNPLQAMFS